MRADFQLTKVLVVVKTYPNPSMKHDETVCTAGITESGEWLRIYPVPFRYLPLEQRYKKYQWIELGLTSQGHANDQRRESREPDMSSLRILGEPLPTSAGWKQRREIVDPMPHSTLQELKQAWARDYTSLGIIRPTEVLDLEITKGDAKWSPKHEAKMSRPRLFGKTKDLERIPYRFHYIFRCDDAPEPHRLMFEDWELGALFLKERRAKGDHMALDSVRDKFLNVMCGTSRDTRFFVGSRHPYNQWLVIGLFCPPLVPPGPPTLFT